MSRTFSIGAVIAVALSLPFYGYRWNIFMHILGAVFFMGNIMVTAVWASVARRSRNTEAIRICSRGIMVTDAIFTLPGAILILLNGGIIGSPYFRSHAMWLYISVMLFLGWGVVWGGLLIPLQRRLYALMKATPGGASLPADADVLLGRWFRWGGIAAVLALITLVLMVLKPGS